MDQSTYRQQQLRKLDELIKNIRIAMLTTVEEDGSLRSRPMAAPQMAHIMGRSQLHGASWLTHQLPGTAHAPAGHLFPACLSFYVSPSGRPSRSN